MTTSASTQTPPRLTSLQRLERARALDEAIRALHRLRNKEMARLAYRVAELSETGGYLDLSFASLAHYTWDRLCWGPKKTEEVLRLVGRLGRFSLIRAAFEAGELHWTKAVLAARAALKEPEREKEWLEAAKALNKGKLEEKVRGATGEEQTVDERFRFSPEQAALLHEGLRALRDEGLDLDREAALIELVRRGLSGGRAEATGSGGSRFRVLLGHCPGCERTTVVGRGGEEVELSAAAAHRALCDVAMWDVWCFK